MVRGVIFDVDGTLVDSNDGHAKAFVEAFARHGHDVPLERVRRLIGMGSDKLIPQALGNQADEALVEAIGDEKGRIFKEQYLPQIRPFPQVRELAIALRDAGIRLAVASSAQKEELTKLLDIARVTDLLHAQSSASEAESSKPDPDIIAAAQKQLGLGADELVVVGDTPYDIEAAARVRIRSIAFRCGGYWDDDALSSAVAIADGPAEMLSWLTEGIFSLSGEPIVTSERRAAGGPWTRIAVGGPKTRRSA